MNDAAATFLKRTIDRLQHRFMRARLVAGEHLRRDGAVKEILPEGAALIFRKARLDGVAIAVGEIGERAGARRNQRLDLRTQLSSEHRRGAVC